MTQLVTLTTIEVIDVPILILQLEPHSLIAYGEW